MHSQAPATCAGYPSAQRPGEAAHEGAPRPSGPRPLHLRHARGDGLCGLRLRHRLLLRKLKPRAGWGALSRGPRADANSKLQPIQPLPPHCPTAAASESPSTSHLQPFLLPHLQPSSYKGLASLLLSTSPPLIVYVFVRVIQILHCKTNLFVLHQVIENINHHNYFLQTHLLQCLLLSASSPSSLQVVTIVIRFCTSSLLPSAPDVVQLLTSLPSSATDDSYLSFSRYLSF